MTDIDLRLKDTIGRVTGGVFAGLTHEFPVAARNDAVLTKACSFAGKLSSVKRRDGSVLPNVKAWSFTGKDQDRWWESSLWVHPAAENYRTAWSLAAAAGLVPFLNADPARNRDGWTSQCDFNLDHVFPRSWALAATPPFRWVRLFPTDKVVNQLTGSTWEGPAVREYRSRPKNWPDVVYASELQIAKMVGHPTS